jgi:hypothetical protein|tara:strand:- start:534 stop:1496 length:963 start_codon:yes stop_codon:yes gene_type:complete
MIVYKATNRLNNKVYFCVTSKRFNDAVSIQISKSKAIERKMKLKPSVRMGKSPFQKALCKYGSNNFHFSIISSFSSKKDAYTYKEQCILEHNAMNPDFGYNCTTGGQESVKFSPESHQRMSDAQKGKTMPESYVKMMKERIGVLNPHFGVKRSKETRERIRQGRINSDYIPSKETKNKTSETMKKRWKNPTEKMLNDAYNKKHQIGSRDIRGKNNPMYGKGFFGKDNPMYGRTGALSPNYGIPVPQWQKVIISKKNKEHARKRREKLLKEYSQRTEKKCCKCKEIKTLEMFYKSSNSLDGLAGHCKPCDLKRKKRKRRGV